MATERLEMRQIREILRLRWQEGLTIRQTANSVGRSVGAVQKVAERATAAGLDWTAVEGLDEATLELRNRSAGDVSPWQAEAAIVGV